MFTVVKTNRAATTYNWYVLDEQNRVRGGAYNLKRQAQRMADRWNADPAIAELEAPVSKEKVQ